MSNYILIIVTAIFVNNIVLSQFLGICPFFGVSKKINGALGMGLAVTFVMVISSSICWSIHQYFLVPFKIQYLQTITFILVIASLVQLVEMVIRKLSPALYQALGVYLPLITTNCAVLGVAILNIQKDFPFLETVVHSLANAAGFTLALFLFACIRERLEEAEIPETFKGRPIILIVAGLMSIAFLGFSGLTLFNGGM